MMAQFRELSLAEMLADPIVRALMAADGVTADELAALLRSAAQACAPPGKAAPKSAPRSRA